MRRGVHSLWADREAPICGVALTCPAIVWGKLVRRSRALQLRASWSAECVKTSAEDIYRATLRLTQSLTRSTSEGACAWTGTARGARSCRY